jgi:putative inorganic carbon (HCO3(-)) transporter
VPKGSRKQRHLLALAGLLTLGGLVGLAVIGPDRLISLWQDPAQETAVGSLGSLNFRQEVWRWTIVAIQDFPFTGVGLGSFRRVIRRLYPLNIVPGYEVAHAHNLYLHTAVDIGIPGLILYLSLVGVVLLLGWQVARHNEQLRPYALGLLSGLIAFHIYGLGDVLALGSKTGVAFWFLLGLITTLHQISLPPAESRPKPAQSVL